MGPETAAIGIIRNIMAWEKEWGTAPEDQRNAALFECLVEVLFCLVSREHGEIADLGGEDETFLRATWRVLNMKRAALEDMFPVEEAGS